MNTSDKPQAMTQTSALSGKRHGRTRAERGSISAEQIIAGAMPLAEAIGLDALSMPKLAEHLGIGVTSIYWYFRNKNDLIEALTVVAAQRFHDVMWVPPDIAWDERLFGSFLRLRAAMRYRTSSYCRSTPAAA